MTATEVQKNKEISAKDLIWGLIGIAFLIGVPLAALMTAHRFLIYPFVCEEQSQTIASIGGCTFFSCGVTFADGTRGEIRNPTIGQTVNSCISYQRYLFKLKYKLGWEKRKKLPQGISLPYGSVFTDNRGIYYQVVNWKGELEEIYPLSPDDLQILKSNHPELVN